MLSALLAYAADDPATTALASQGGRAFVSQSLKPYVVAALAQEDPGKPLVVVAGDDRHARDLAADLRTWLAPRPVRFYPSRGVTYESHLAPPPHLVGLRVAALDALLDEGKHEHGAPVVVVSAVALSEKVPDPRLRPHGFVLGKGDLLDLDECAVDLVAAGYERVEQVEDRGQFAIRVDMFDVEIESLRWFSTFTQRSLGDVQQVEIAPAAELAAEHRELAEAAAIADDASERRDVAELLPVGDFHAMLDLVPDAAVLIAADEEIAPALTDHWQDVVAAFHDDDAHHLYIAPDAIETALSARAKIRLSAIDQDQPHQFRGQAADVAARSVKDAEPELEKLVRSGYRTVIAFGARGEGERAAYNLGRLKVRWVNGAAPQGADLAFAEARLRDGFVAPGFRLAVIPEHRLFRRRPGRTGGTGAGAGRRRGALRSFTDLRSGDIVVHEDHGLARFAGFDTKTVAGVTRDYLNLEFQGSDKVFMPVDQLAKISRYVGAGGDHPPLSKLGGTRWETMKARRRRRGFAFPPDSDWLREFETAFPYRETPDQREAIEHVKWDMEAEKPMDRLICGDVGYGKTEVALRAAFKAANAGKQVLMLVPTTILAQQHFGTFTERLR